MPLAFQWMITLSFINHDMHCTHFIAIFLNIEKGASYPIESIKRPRGVLPKVGVKRPRGFLPRHDWYFLLSIKWNDQI